MKNIDVLKLADEVEMWGEDLLALNMKGGIPVVQGAKMLRQQADLIRNLQKSLGFKNSGYETINLTPQLELTDAQNTIRQLEAKLECYERLVDSINMASNPMGVKSREALRNVREMKTIMTKEEEIRKAVEAEREACAKVADEYANGLERNYSEIIADLIRARSKHD